MTPTLPFPSQVWDLTAGKLLHEFQHEDSITGLEFHPSEFVLATSSADLTVKWWDLETSELIDTTGPEVTGQHQATPALCRAGLLLHILQLQCLVSICVILGVKVWPISCTGLMAEVDRLPQQ